MDLPDELRVEDSGRLIVGMHLPQHDAGADLTIIEHCLPRVRRDLTRIAATATGLHLFYGGAIKLTRHDASISPRRPPIHFVRASAIIHALTGLTVVWPQYFGHTRAIVATRDGSCWHLCTVDVDWKAVRLTVPKG